MTIHITPPSISRKSWVHISFFLFSVFFGGALAYHLGQDMNWDLLNYHYYNPFAFLHGRVGTDVQPAQFQGYVNPLLDVPAYLFITHLSPMLSGILLGMVQGINAWLIFEIALIMFRQFIGDERVRYGLSMFIATLSILGAASRSEFGNTMGDELTSLLVLGSLLLLLVSFNQNKVSPIKLRVIAYALTGASVGLKLTNVPFAIALLLGGLVMGGSAKYKIKRVIFYGVITGLAVLITSGFWYIKMWHMVRNPAFPYYNQIFQSPYYPSFNFSDTRWFPKDLLGYILYPFKIARWQSTAADVPFRDGRFAVLCLAFVATVIVGLYRKIVLKRPGIAKQILPAERVFWIFIAVSYILWAKEFSYYRYLLTLELVVLVAIGILGFRIIRNARIAFAGLALLFIGITLYTIPLNWGRTPWQPEYFGPNLRHQLDVNNATILMAGSGPLSFLVPYFPTGTRAIRIESNITYPSFGTSAESSLIKNAIAQDLQSGKTFYAIETSSEKKAEVEALAQYGFYNNSCQNVDTYAGQYLYFGTMQYQLCGLNVNLAGNN